MHFLKTLIGALLIGALVTPPVFAQQAPVREITQIKGNLYRFRNNFHYSVFVVTPAGIIATDPINAEAARWLKAELAKRFNLPVKYLLYSHDHADHISGGEVFADTAVVVSHDNAKRTIVGERRPTAVPQVTFSDNLTIELGGTVVELSHVGRNHSDNSVVMRFPAERVLFAVDFIPVNELPFRDFPDGWMPDWIDSLKRVEAMDFDVLAPGHGSLGSKTNVGAVRVYLEELRAEVTRLAREGKSLDEIKQAVKMEKYASWGSYKNLLPLHTEEM